MTTQRRPKGTGSKVYAHRGGFQCYATVEGRKVYFSGPSAVAAEFARSEWLRECGAGLDPDAGKMTVKQLMERWTRHLDDTMRADRPRTYRSYADTATLHIIPALGEYGIRELKPSHVESLVAAKMRAGASHRTATYNRVVLRIALNWAMREGWLSRNVAALAKMPEDRAQKPPPATLGAADAKRIIAYPHRLRVLWLTALTTGLRQAELLGLQWEDVDLAVGAIDVRHQLQWIDDELKLRPVTKTRGSTARVLLAPLTVNALRSHQRKAGVESGYVFVGVRGQPINARNLIRSWEVVLTHLGLPHIDFRDATRATCATLLYEEGVPDKIIQSVLRHARLSTTMDIYVRQSADGQSVATEAMQRLFGDNEEGPEEP